MGGPSMLGQFRKTACISVLLSLLFHIGSSFIVKRDGDPYFLKTPENITVREGELAVLKCHIDRLGPKMVNVVVWRRVDEDYPLTIGETNFSTMDMAIDHAQLSATSSSWDLLIKNTQRFHAGVYECQVTANHLIAKYVTLNVIEREKLKSDQTRHRHGRLKHREYQEERHYYEEYAEASDAGVNVKPTDMSIVGTKYVNLGSKLHLSCNATGVSRAPESIDWFYEGNKIDEMNPRWRKRLQITKQRSITGKYYISDLIIDQSKMSDMGTYLCRSSDLKVNSLKVHILNDPADENIKKREKDPDQVRGEIKRYSGNAGSTTIPCTVAVILNVLTATLLQKAFVHR